MAALLKITEGCYSLSLQVHGKWVELASLDGGSQSLIPGNAGLSEAALERAIDLAEDWLMPHAKSLRGETLGIRDVAGSFEAGLRNVLNVEARQFSVAAIEDCFLQVVALAASPSASSVLRHQQHFVATLVLVRELAHHGGVRGMQLLG